VGGAGRGGNSGSAGGGTAGNAGIGGASSTGGTGGGARTPGCGKAGSAKGAQHLDMNVGGRARKYWRWVPSGYDPNRPIPIIFAWHGSGGDGDEVRRTYFYLEPVVRDGAIILYPDGLPVNGGSTGWDLAAEGIDVKFFDAMLAAVSQDYCVDLAHVFSTGYSYGGMFSYALACSRGSKLRAIAPTAGAIFGGSSGCSTPVPAWIAHGTNDDLVPYSSAQSARDVWLRINGCGTATTPTSPSPCVAYQCPANAPVHWCVHNEGHEWPSFAAQGIWAFFSRL
jgi:poly(3-hydroxybutyrate) depolymerase